MFLRRALSALRAFSLVGRFSPKRAAWWPRLQAVGDKLDVALGEPGSGQSAGLLPRVDDLTRELSASSRQLGRVLQMLEESPQSLIFGRPRGAARPRRTRFFGAFRGPGAAPQTVSLR